MSKHHYLLEWFGRIPEHYTLYPLPDDRQAIAVKDRFRIGMTLESGEVLIFEYDVPVPCRQDIPWEDLENSLPHHCQTCEWDFMRGKGTSYCRSAQEICGGACPEWEISPDAIRLATVEYYKQLHEKHYGKRVLHANPHSGTV